MFHAVRPHQPWTPGSRDSTSVPGPLGVGMVTRYKLLEVQDGRGHRFLP